MQGLLLIDKPQGMTSFSVVARIKRLCQTKRVGHTGTLDPLATGVLPIFIGRPTVLCSHLLEADKTYRATVQLGLTTDSYDITGKVLTRCENCAVSQEKLLQVLESFVGEQKQVPPMFSALKQNGVRLYNLARQGREVERPARTVCIHHIQLLQFSKTSFEIEVCCSKGTYIRSLVQDIGNALKTGAVLTALRRVQTGCFEIGQCVSLETLEQQGAEAYLKSPELAVMHYPAVQVSKKQAARFSNGGSLSFERLQSAGPLPMGQTVRLRCADCAEEFIGLGFVDEAAQAITVVCGVNFVQLPKGDIHDT